MNWLLVGITAIKVFIMDIIQEFRLRRTISRLGVVSLCYWYLDYFNDWSVGLRSISRYLLFDLLISLCIYTLKCDIKKEIVEELALEEKINNPQKKQGG